MSSHSNGAWIVTARWHVNPWNIAVTVITLCFVSRIIKYINARKAVRNVPSVIIAFEPMKLPGLLIPTSWWNPGYEFPWKWRDHVYKDRNTEIIAFIPLLSGVTNFYTNNLDIARQIVAGGAKSIWIKPEDFGEVLIRWGMNVLAAEREQWRKHRRVMGPAFNNELYHLVWSETIKIYQDMLTQEGWINNEVNDVEAVQSLTFKVALLVIAKCGFGFSFDWTESPASPDSPMSIQTALQIFSDETMILTAVPKPLLRLPVKKFKEIRTAIKTITEFMRHQVIQRTDEVRHGTSTGRDAFSMLVRANEGENSKYRLDDSEVIGNVFILMFAGHDTTAHALAATFGFLAYYEDIQEEVYQQIISVTGDRDLEFSDYSHLTKVIAVFYEATRMYPPGHVLMREASEDTVLNIPNPPGEEGSTPLPIPKGTPVMIDMVGIQYNTRHIDEPEKFKPWRWLGMTSEEQYTAFSFGPRVCIGRKFATVEAVAFLTALLRDWKVVPKLNDGETKEQWRARTTDAKYRITLGIVDVPLTFVRRS